MNNVSSVIKNPHFKRATIFTTLLFSIGSICAQLAIYFIEKKYNNPAIEAELNQPVTQPLSDAAMQYSVIYGIATLVISVLVIATVIFAYKRAYKIVNKGSFEANEQAALTAGAFAAGSVLSIITYPISIAFPISSGGSSSAITDAAIEVGGSVALAVFGFIVVKYFARKRALKEQEELFS